MGILRSKAKDSPVSSILEVDSQSKSTTPETTGLGASKPPSGHQEETDDERDELDLIGTSPSAMDVSESGPSQPTKGPEFMGSQSEIAGDSNGNVPDNEVKEDKATDEDMHVDAQPSSEPSDLTYPSSSPARITDSTKTTFIAPAAHTPAEHTQSAKPQAMGIPQPEPTALKATPTEVGISPGVIFGHKNHITIPAPLEPSHSVDESVEPTTLPEHGPPAQQSGAYDFQNPNRQYTLPPASVLPAEFSNRKKASKRKKDRSERKSDDLPMGLNRWAATIISNPVHIRMKRAMKCLSTKDWSVRYYRTRRPGHYSKTVACFPRVSPRPNVRAYREVEERRAVGIQADEETAWRRRAYEDTLGLPHG